MASFECSANKVTVENIRMCCMQRECIFPALFRLKRRRKFSISSAIVSHFNGNDDDDDDDG